MELEGEGFTDAVPVVEPEVAALFRLGCLLEGRGFVVRRVVGGMTVGLGGGRGAVVEVGCGARGDDGGRLWFFFRGGAAFAEAGDVVDAVLWVGEVVVGGVGPGPL
ncbi:hypothetical protein [Actinocorallia sp. A-T 12471]|uniref:hypothetical protein n=1 Tax=Actinocorallia sp. A-T 12471 TaxID=3089813 RepID=UPI0029D1F109|nr:hypothetical protein [Actinocorallia sp. A-T 12471]MDX6739613.1 hypothetical protein [Actinocorallia sp. A-T 12471]